MERRRSAALWGVIGVFVVLTTGLALPVVGAERPPLGILVAVALVAGTVAGGATYALEPRLVERGV